MWGKRKRGVGVRARPRPPSAKAKGKRDRTPTTQARAVAAGGSSTCITFKLQTFKTRAAATSRASLTNSCRQLVPHLKGLPVTSINFRLVGVLYVAHLKVKMSGFGCHRLEPALSLQHEAAPLSVAGRRTVLTVAEPAGHAVAVRAWI